MGGTPRFKGGYAGQELLVDLTKGKISKKPLDKNFAKKYIGTLGFISRILWDHVGPKADPLGPDNHLIFSTGPLTGTLVPGSSTLIVGAKSPLTGIIGYGTSGGHWAHKLKMAGYDLVVVRGKAKKPAYIWVSDENVEVRDASHIWGRDNRDTYKLIIEDVNDYDIDAVVIGQAGENLVRGANVLSTLCHSASYGMGAVMGSKNLKAVAVRGSHDVKIAEPKVFIEAWKEFMDDIMSDRMVRVTFMKLGTTNIFRIANELGQLCTRNFQTGVFKDADKVDGEAVYERYLMKTRGCSPCPVCCDRFCIITDGPYKGTWVGGPEYATLTNFGSKLGNSDLAALLKAYELCDLYGLDTYFTADAIAFAMEIYEKGIITSKETDGLKLRWGNSEAMHEMIRNIALRKGFGNVLAEGATSAAKKIGKGSEYYVMECKGSDISCEDPRVNNENALAVMTSPRGGDPNYSWMRLTHFTHKQLKELFDIDVPQHVTTTISRYEYLGGGLPTGMRGIGKATKWWVNRARLVDLCGVCLALWMANKDSGQKLFSRFNILSSMYSAATGFETSLETLLEASERMTTLQKAYNIREKGIGRKEDMPPERFLKEPMPDGPAKGKVWDKLEEQLNEYYEAWEWDQRTGWPTKKNYEKLGLNDVYEYLKKVNRVPELATQKSE